MLTRVATRRLAALLTRHSAHTAAPVAVLASLRRGRAKATTATPNDVEDPRTPLGAHLRKQIEARGPLSVFDFMRESNVNPRFGYYATQNVLGRAGDFVTSPELTPVFGTLMGVWVVLELQRLGGLQRCSLLELGPGHGTMMRDMLQTITAVPELRGGVTVHVLEASEKMRRAQHATLRCVEPVDEAHSARTVGDAVCARGTTAEGVSVEWHTSLACALEGNDVLIVVSNEFLDALPIYRFQRVDAGWREVMVDSNANGDGAAAPAERELRFVISPSATVATRSILQASGFYPPEMLERFASGASIEVSPLAISTVENVAAAVKRRRGSAVFVDYGADRCYDDSLMGIRGHRQVHPLHRPGECDLSVQVDFDVLHRAVLRQRLLAYRTVSQAAFLNTLGIGYMAQAALRAAAGRPEEQAAQRAVYERLLSPNAMGEAYRAFAFTSSSDAPPTGFRPATAPPPPAAPRNH